MDDYGKLSGRSLDEMLAGARVEWLTTNVTPRFCAVKPSAQTEPGWDPWGRGRPGWHIEYSVMAEKHLVKLLIFMPVVKIGLPENEIAQSCCAVVRPWRTFGCTMDLSISTAKKCLNHWATLIGQGLLEHFPGEVLRYVILSAHYRTEQNFSKELLDSAWRSLDSLYGYLRGCGQMEAKLNHQGEGYKALLDDLNTPVALSEVHRLARLMHSSEGDEKRHLQAGS